MQGKNAESEIFLAFSRKALKIKTMKIQGEKIRLFREARGWSVAQFARVCGVRRQAVEAWERGHVKKFETLAKIASKLGVTERSLVD